MFVLRRLACSCDADVDAVCGSGACDSEKVGWEEWVRRVGLYV